MEVSRTAVGVLAGLCLAGGAAGALFIARSGTPIEANQTESTAIPGAADAVVAEPAPAPAATQRSTSVRPRAAARAATAPVNRAPATAGAPATANERTAEAAVRNDAAGIEAAPAFESPAALEPFPSAAAEPPAPQFEEFVIPADSVVGLQVETSLTSETASVEDEVVARVTRDIRVGDRVAIPAGSRAYGTVTAVERGGRMKERARLGVSFSRIVLGDGTRVPIDADTIFREGSSPAPESAAKIGGGALGGAVIGGIFGGGKGAAIGSAIGAGAGTAAVYAGGRNAATLPAGTTITVRLLEPAYVTVVR